ncbi:RsmB/NOP family class I SAM-dependent RNA methyltransferase [Shewanella intestini]|uniref:RsmB/NOP family class I SAM-dependent RNA methyltransferase n=1 Tax=Shewanella intestini TaxID=2017544 RepID=A0ABS5I0J1_9GAMM|nr:MULTISPECIES: RsmB/NOP family class I SAM-dependent RNA methyltransferase [Shewanella]MBR9727353.1 RsmB/NOP family class I SAM-dependent RNA methyltransferase [Shewanella intestini]MRG35597.1 RsmB/NOP family class I SAM-dependent RNA methyltransferase [Shewanella sp. XMDDZSB0408]
MTTFSTTSAKMPLTVTDMQVDSAMQRRAISYANTLFGLFDQVMVQKQPADRILAEYFRAHKQHGSKDRKVIRETLFSVFRWWGWLKKFGDYQDSNTFFSALSVAGALEQHSWQPLTQAWLQLSHHSIDLSVFYQDEQVLSAAQKCQLLTHVSSIPLDLIDLVPDWFREACPVAEKQQTKLIEALCTRPPIWARAQNIDVKQLIKNLATQEIHAIDSPHFIDALNLGTKSINLPSVDSYKRGQIEIQDLASQVIGQICQPKPHEQWWDACSGAGGKTLQLRSLMLQQDSFSSGSIIASDIRKKPLIELVKRAKRANFDNITTMAWKDNTLPVKAAAFDGVLVDAPCSCTGTWRRNPDMRWIDDSRCIEDKPALQLDILSRSAAAVKTGGKLVYATCSISPQENEAVVNAFAQQHPEFSQQRLTHPFTHEKVTMLTVWPQEANSDGMFVAVFIKQ